MSESGIKKEEKAQREIRVVIRLEESRGRRAGGLQRSVLVGGGISVISYRTKSE